MENYNHFVVIVAGENPDELMQQYLYDNSEIEILYKKEDAHKLKLQHIEMAKALLNNTDSEYEKMELEDIILTLNSQTDEEFFEDLADDYDIDEEGNIIGTSNENKFETYNIGKNLSTPFILKDGRTKFQALKNDINWDRIHLFGMDMDFYRRVWEISVEGDTPQNDTEIEVKKNMGNKKSYFAFFGDKETYACHSSAFWGYAFLSEETGWIELTCDKSQIEWVMNYYDTFIKPLPENTLLTIFECRR